MAKHLSEDEITLTINAKAQKAQQNIHTFSKEIDRLGERNKSLQRQMESLEIAEKKDSESWRQRRAEYGKNAKQIRKLKQEIADETKALDLNALTMSQLKQQARTLQRQLDNTSKSLNPDEWKQLSNRLTEVKVRMNDLSSTSKGLIKNYSDPQVMSFFRGELFIRFAELTGKAALKIKEFANESVELARGADGVIHAFRQLNQPALLGNLRKATKGTVSDIDLMKAAVKARDFNIPLEDLGKYLSFAQLKAQQLDVSVQQMTDDIVTGLGRQSPQILDNLGLSAAEIKEQTKETGDFMKGVAKIVENNLAAAGETYISAADRAAQKTTTLQNKQLELGEALLPLKEEASKVFGSMKMGIMDCIIWLATHRKATIALSLALTALTISMTVLNTAFRAWMAQTVIAKAVMAGWTSTVTMLKGIYLLVAASINTMRGNTVLATAQMRLFNMTCKSNVILLLVTALVAAGVALYAYISKLEKSKVAMVNLNLEHARTAAAIKRQNKEIEKSVNESTAAEITKIKALQKTIHDSSKSYNQRKQAIQNMQAIVPGYHASINREGRLFNENTKAIDIYIQNLRRAARAEAAYEKMKANEKEILDAEDAIGDAAQKHKNVGAAAQRRGVNLKNGERVERRTQTVGTGSTGYVMSNDYFVVVNKKGKVLREIDKKTAAAVMKDQNWGDMFSSRSKAAQDRKSQLSKQNDRLQKVIEQNGGFKIGGKLQRGSSVSSVGAKLDTTSAKSGGGKKVNKDNKTVDADSIASRNFSSSRQSSLDAANAAYQKDVNNLNMSLAQKKISQEQYDIYTSALNTQHATNLLTIEQNYYTKSTQMAFKDAAKKKELETGQSKNVAQAKQKFEEARIAAEEKYQGVMTQLIDQGKVQQTLTLEQERDAKLEVLRGYYDTALQLAQQSGEDESAVDAAYKQARLNILSEYNDKQLAKMKEFEQQKAQARQEYGLDSFEDQLAARRKKIDEDFAKGVLTEQQHQQALTNLDQQAEQHRLQIRQQYGLATQQELYNAELEMLQLHLQNKEISQQEYEEAVKNLKIQKAKEAFDYYANLASGAVKALQDAEIANVDAKYDAEIEAARNAGKDTTDIEKKKAEEKLNIQKKYADVNFAIQAAQIIASTASAVAKTFAELGYPAGIPAAILMSITGTAQLALAYAERQKVKRMTLSGASGSASASGARVATGLESGGSIDIEREQDGKLFHAAYDPNRRGFINKPTVIVGEGGYGHSKEWVASNAAVENPTVAPIIDIIDRAQRAGKIRTLDMNKFLIQQASGRASGGHIIPTTSDVRGIAQDPLQNSLIKRLTDVLDSISTNGIAASVALNELEQKQQLRDKARKYGSKS